MTLTPFEILFLTHFISDWMFQTSWESMNKSKQFLPLFVHCSVYTVFFIPIFYFLKINMLLLILLFVSHMILDNRKFLFWWLHNIKRTKQKDVGDITWTILVIAMDQILHLAVLGLVLFLNSRL